MNDLKLNNNDGYLMQIGSIKNILFVLLNFNFILDLFDATNPILEW